MNDTQQTLDEAVLRTVRAIIVRDLSMAIPRPTGDELARLRSIALSRAASFGTRLCAERALAWFTDEEMSGPAENVLLRS